MSNSIAYVSVLLKTYTDDALSAIIKKGIWKLKREEKGGNMSFSIFFCGCKQSKSFHFCDLSAKIIFF